MENPGSSNLIKSQDDLSQIDIDEDTTEEVMEPELEEVDTNNIVQDLEETDSQSDYGKCLQYLNLNLISVS